MVLECHCKCELNCIFYKSSFMIHFRCYHTAGPGVTLGSNKARSEQGAWKDFVQSVRARLTVAQVVEGVRANATFTFDFLLLLIVAA